MTSQSVIQNNSLKSINNPFNAICCPCNSCWLRDFASNVRHQFVRKGHLRTESNLLPHPDLSSRTNHFHLPPPISLPGGTCYRPGSVRKSRTVCRRISFLHRCALVAWWVRFRRQLISQPPSFRPKPQQLTQLSSNAATQHFFLPCKSPLWLRPPTAGGEADDKMMEQPPAFFMDARGGQLYCCIKGKLREIELRVGAFGNRISQDEIFTWLPEWILLADAAQQTCDS